MAQQVKNLPVNEGDTGNAGLTPRLGRSPGRSNGDLLQYSFLENSMDRGAWQATVHGVTELDMTEQLAHKEQGRVEGWLWKRD